MILVPQIAELVSLVKTDMTNAQSGTDDTLFFKTQTGLITPVGATDIALSDKSSTSSSVFASHVITTSLGNGSTLVEFEINNGTYSYNRAVRAPLVKGSQIEYTVFHTFVFEVVL